MARIIESPSPGEMAGRPEGTWSVSGDLEPDVPLAGASGWTGDDSELYRTHSPRIYRYCFAYLRNHADAQDASQETFTRLSQQMGRITRDVTSYLNGIARNVCYDMSRSRCQRHVPIETISKADPRHRPEDEALARAQLHRTLVGLSSNDRALLAYTCAGFSHREISSITGASPKAVSVAITRARQRARRVSLSSAS